MLLEIRSRLLLLRRTGTNENSQDSVTKAPAISPPGLPFFHLVQFYDDVSIECCISFCDL